MFTNDKLGIKKAYDCILSKCYEGNAELAEQLEKFISNVKSLGSTKNGADSWVTEISNKLGLSNSTEYYMLITVMTADTNKMRVEYDEEYVEYGFLSIEDGGRGVEF